MAVVKAGPRQSLNGTAVTKPCHDLGGGWFFALDEDWRTTDGHCPRAFVGDALDPTPDTLFGAAAWGRGTGPSSCGVLLEIEHVDIHSQPDGDYPPTPFPGVIQARQKGVDNGLGNLHGVRCETLEDLLAIISTRRPEGGHLPEAEPDDRTARFFARYPDLRDDRN